MDLEIRRQYFLDGQIRSEKEYLNHVLNGRIQYYYISGKTQCKFYAKNGLDHGIGIFFDFDEDIKDIIQWSKGNEHGVNIEFNYGN